MKAYMLVVTEPASLRAVAARLRGFRGVTEVHEVMGPYDLVAELETASVMEISPLLFDTIRQVDGVQSTTTLVALPGQ